MKPSISEKTILIVDDAPANIYLLMEILKKEYATIPATSGNTALQKIADGLQPDLILLDIMMPGIDGYEVCRQLKADEGTRDIPVIFISAATDSLRDAKAFEVGAADYVSKPFEAATVKARVKHQIELRAAILELQRLYQVALDSNPITGLPGNNSIRKTIEAAVKDESYSFVVYADLDNFKAFNDKYGFALGDEIIHYTASLLEESLVLHGSADTFLGHIGGDDFVLLLPRKGLQKTVDFILQHFDEKIASFYSSEDVARRCIQSINRQGEVCSVPLMSISLGIVDLQWSNYKHFIEVNDACAQVKKKAKEISGSSFFLDRRKRESPPDTKD